MSRYISIADAIALLRAQIEGLKSRAELQKGLPKPLAELEAHLATLVTADTLRATLEREAALATEAAYQAAFEGRSAARRNIKAVARRHGKYSPDLLALGGKPRKGGRRTTEPTDTTDAADDLDFKVA